ncbi:exopolysaccharide biosynthesis protein [Marilutibacter alkalisoli]|uniref:Exopolysaccharide biosynthesis protein n=1 Tax=Marilutibacter alkalisoli TaxID=2591633 RepID=A0A514BQ03_9GAMM|nr:exopolysaccharide biosynthesis protein [Lysobacter alkalisoli]QDH69482.1 exopolysaccharide biosynthesis protein [Lysobacter alkalisoli]
MTTSDPESDPDDRADPAPLEGLPPPKRVSEAGTRALLDAFAVGDPDTILRLGDVFAGLGKRSFGMLLFIATLPAFVPIPGFGAVSGPLAMLLGAQLMIGLRKPWLPGFISRRGPTRHSMVRFRNRLSPWLTRLEKVVRPRASFLLDHRLASIVTGLLLILLGVLLSLPIPFTNLLFGALLLLFALALIERDGYLMAVAWVIGGVAVAVFGILSGSLAAMAADGLQMLGFGQATG